MIEQSCGELVGWLAAERKVSFTVLRAAFVTESWFFVIGRQIVSFGSVLKMHFVSVIKSLAVLAPQ